MRYNTPVSWTTVLRSVQWIPDTGNFFPAEVIAVKKSMLSVLTALFLTAALILSACQKPVEPSGESIDSQAQTPASSETGSATGPTSPSSSAGPSSSPSDPSASSAETSTEEETLPPDTRIQFVPTQTSLFFRQDGTVLSAEITGFDNSGFDSTRYTEDGLREMVLGWVEEYNRSVGKTAVNLESVTVADKKATLILSYDTTESFMGFQGSDFGVKELMSVTVGASKKMGVALTGMKNAAGEAVTAAAATENNDWNLLMISGKVLVMTEDRILFCSDSLTLTDEYTVRVSSEEPVYLIFK